MTTGSGLLEHLGIRTSPDSEVHHSRPRKALIWARVSTNEQSARGLSIPEQLREIRSFAASRSIEIVGEHQEVASAFKRGDRRFKFHRMLERAKTDPSINVILVHDFSRFSRDNIEAPLLIRDLREAGVQLISVTDPEVDPETISGVFMEAVTFANHRAYSLSVAMHTRKGCRANVQTRDPESNWCYKNGGQPLWGYKSVRLERGQERKGKPIIKSIWELDDLIVADRPVHEWVHHCLVELAANGASLKELRDFCNEKGFPARRKQYWGVSTWNALLRPDVLGKYCGYGIWNVHGRKGKVRSPSDWVIEPNSHPAILTEEEAVRVAEARRAAKRKPSRLPQGRSRVSQYLLSGGLFRCGRCGSNMTGFSVPYGPYYICGSQPYRKGRGCGPGVYVRVDLVEGEVIRGVGALVSHCSDPKGFARMVNEEIQKLWDSQNGQDLATQQKHAEIEKKIGNVRKAIEDGINDAEWANTRLKDLELDRAALPPLTHKPGPPPKLSVQEVMHYRGEFEKVFANGTIQDKKKLLRIWIDEIKLAPEQLEIEISFRVPEPFFMNQLVAGALFVAIHDRLRPWLTRTVRLPRNGRHTVPQRRTRTPRLAHKARSIPPPLHMPVTTRNGPQTQLPGAALLRGAS